MEVRKCKLPRKRKKVYIRTRGRAEYRECYGKWATVTHYGPGPVQLMLERRVPVPDMVAAAARFRLEPLNHSAAMKRLSETARLVGISFAQLSVNLRRASAMLKPPQLPPMFRA